ncbi:hydrogenase nickel incorporation protein HypA/HybF [Chitinophaga costaii]|uniref:Hydrogenase nickel incorporation protein HypA/HybF n=1 Tax=Chitinophaga costaii TaxID=1335309 RepID=A0A1C4FKP6_9BACT|nr:hydrogenase maturation nickel metallochaperone HypA [Chitinophaga costaii]PUZ30011.1 hydrogenase maturation nickel metallochaperone HypA [Chitinophaga costaii]SCC56195.1 hydrogenase nickel incorporation protein HypA/HybF [Chitinophaga costaii]
MHEISLVRNIFNTLEDEFPGKMDDIRGIYLTVGILSNVQPLLMQSAFEAVQQDEPKYANTHLHVEVLPIQIKCDICDAISSVEQYKFICKTCGRPCSHVIQGEELLISKVEFAT